MIERTFDISFIANLALSEKQIHQNHRPVIAVQEWLARRCEYLNQKRIMTRLCSHYWPVSENDLGG